MRKILLGGKLEVPCVALGCMRIGGMEHATLAKHINCCVENGINFFDHADIYGGGACEEAFCRAFDDTGLRREDIILQSKCGIVPGKMYDLSKEHIIKSVDGILSRLGIDYLDLLVLHRPDALVEPEEVASAFDELESAGKVRYFGVSNHNSYQIELLKKYVRQDILVNQLQLSITEASMISSGLEVNMATDGAINRDGSVLDYCRLNDITIQTWSPFQHGFFGGNFVGDREKFEKLNSILDALAEKYSCSPSAIASAWILRHPAKMQLIAGTTSSAHLADIIVGSSVELTREEWYSLYLSAPHILP